MSHINGKTNILGLNICRPFHLEEFLKIDGVGATPFAVEIFPYVSERELASGH